MKILYVAEATAYGGRNGRVTSSDDRLDVEVAPPKEVGGADGDATNPEQLFAGGYAACFMNAASLVGQRMKADTEGMTVTAKVGLGQVETGYGLEVELVVNLPKLDNETAQALVERTHYVCPYSNATRGNIEVTLTIA